MKTEKKQGAAEEQEVKVEEQELEQEQTDQVTEEDDDDDLSWMQEEEPDSSEEGEAGDDDDDDDDDAKDEAGKVPVEKHIKIKQKLKGKLSKKDEENEQLKARIVELEAGKSEVPTADAPEKPKRPRRADFETDDAYDDALDEYDEKLINYIPQSLQSKTEREEQAKAQVDEVKKAEEAHLDRAAKLIEKHGIDPDVYKGAQDNVKKIITDILPKNVPAENRQGAAEFVFNQFISMVGEGSEKTFFYVGKNKSASNEFERLMRSDPTGLKAAFYLGSVNTEIAGKKNLNSRASKPASRLKGGGKLPANEANLRKQYQTAHKAEKGQKAYELKQKAKKAGIDVSAW